MGGGGGGGGGSQERIDVVINSEARKKCVQNVPLVLV